MVYLGFRGRSLRTVLSLVAATAFALQGYDQAVMNGLLTLPTFLGVFPGMANAAIEGTVVALYEVGCALGALSCAFIGDPLGRRRTIFAAGCTALVGVILQSSTFVLGQLVTGRIITGLGVGALTATAPMWVSECSNARERGQHVLMQGFFAIGGIVVASWLEFGFYFIKNSSVNWRFPIAFQAFFCLIVASLVLFLPESPRWLVKRGLYNEAQSVMGALEDWPANSATIQQELDQIRTTFADEQDRPSSIWAMGPDRPFHRTVLAIGVALLAQMSGINIVTFYSTSIFEGQLHYSPTESRIFSGCIQIWQFFGSGLAIFLIDRFGRRNLLMAGAVGMCVAQGCLAGLTSIRGNKAAGEAAIFFYFVAMFFFPVSLFLIPFMYAAEISPLSIRHKVTAISACTNWLFNFLVAEVTPQAMRNIGYRYYIVYACINAFSFVVFYLFYPETKGRSLEEINDIFVRSKNVFDPVRVAGPLFVEDGSEVERIRERSDVDRVDEIDTEPAEEGGK
ncbi:general substrate transporter [Aspergillus alliaceus]|uniref:General substrate transporter n=1 Tax=Petromyces alliaceus TaxID=209559 RepID=A0A5N6G3G1_PETAA|nr:general substrate transporter [Aspergillus alliaceus]KAB8235730.1 general substrate transporter [Aspergillus alliaceus]KAE8395987.1 general substrate transporter [Aspergillus alliaceus]